MTNLSLCVVVVVVALSANSLNSRLSTVAIQAIRSVIVSHRLLDNESETTYLPQVMATK